MSIPKPQHETGEQGQFRIAGESGEWFIEATDNNGVWIAAEPGVKYDTEDEAAEALEGWQRECESRNLNTN